MWAIRAQVAQLALFRHGRRPRLVHPEAVQTASDLCTRYPCCALCGYLAFTGAEIFVLAVVGAQQGALRRAASCR